MDTGNAMERFFARQFAFYPRMEARDLVKALYQSEFGCGHLLSGEDQGMRRLQEEEREFAHIPREKEPPFLEPLGEKFCRIHLSGLASNGLAIATLFRLFWLSGQERTGDMARLRAGLADLEALIARGAIPLNLDKARRYLAGYIAAGCPATHHSEAFRRAYSPAYRVVKAEYARYIPLFSATDRLLSAKEVVLVAIEGGSASGKTSLGELFRKLYDCNVLHMDDFFLQRHQRTPERLAEPGGNVDRERFLLEVLQPLIRGEAFAYRKFDCARMELGESVFVQPKRLNVVEGAYSLHPELYGAYDLSVFLEIDAKTQAKRILTRNGEAGQRQFLEKWIPLENHYFERTNARERSTMILETEMRGE